MDTHELAWAAGFFDGEGCVRTARNARSGFGYRFVRATIGQRDRAVLDRFQAAVGFGKVTGPFVTQTRNGAPMYRWETAARDRVHLLCWSLWPWLSPVKRHQFDAAFEKYAQMVPKVPHEPKEET